MSGGREPLCSQCSIQVEMELCGQESVGVRREEEEEEKEEEEEGEEGHPPENKLAVRITFQTQLSPFIFR